MNRRSIVLILPVVVSLLLLRAASAQSLAVHFIDVGQGDAILIECPNGEDHMLIDAADTRYPKSADMFKAFMNDHFQDETSSLEVVVASHPHTDHIGSMQWVLENFEVGTYVDNGHKHDTATFGRLDQLREKMERDGELEYIDGKDQPRAELDPCPGESRIEAEIIVPWAFRSLSDPNDRSAVVRLAFGEVVFLFTGDAEEHAEDALRGLAEDGDAPSLAADVLKVGHHGSHTSSSPDFVEEVNPELAVVSAGRKGVGTNSGYKHPRFKTLRRFSTRFRNHTHGHPTTGRVQAFDASQQKWRQHTRREGLWITPRDGTIVVRTDGDSIEVEIE